MGKQDDLVRYLQIAQKILHEPKVDKELVYEWAKPTAYMVWEIYLE